MTMIFKSLLVLTFLSSLSRVNSLMCYNCGYLELPNGDKVAVTEEFGKIPFCDDFTTNEENTVEAYAGGCCSAFKVEIHQEGSDEIMFLSRHGTANDQDEIWADFTCGEVSSGYTCKNEHITQDGVDDDGKVCHCYSNLCNQETPSPDDNTTPGPDPTWTAGPEPDATCTTSCTTTCTNNQGINDAIRHLQGTITKVVSSNNNPTPPDITSTTTTPNSNPTITTSKGSTNDKPTTKFDRSTTLNNGANKTNSKSLLGYFTILNVILILILRANDSIKV